MRYVLLAACLAGALTLPAMAGGTAKIQQADGTLRVYPNVRITIANRSLRIRSSDGKGTLVIDRAACSMVGDLMRCLPDNAKLEQSGNTRSFALQNGTIWYNRTAQRQPLPYSSMRLVPGQVLLSLTTTTGTYVSLDGTVDK